MNPWDNFLIGLRLAWPAYLGGFLILVIVRTWLYHESNDYRVEDYTDEKYEDGFYIPKAGKPE
jgi:hypothetical protein